MALDMAIESVLMDFMIEDYDTYDEIVGLEIILFDGKCEEQH